MSKQIRFKAEYTVKLVIDEVIESNQICSKEELAGYIKNTFNTENFTIDTYKVEEITEEATNNEN